MNDKIFLLVKCTVSTRHRSIHDAIEELQDGTSLQVSSTKSVKVLRSEIIKLNTRTIKK